MSDGSTSGSRATEGLGTALSKSMLSDFKGGPSVYNKPLYEGLSKTTQTGLNTTANTALAGQGGLNDAYGWAQGVVGSGGYNPALASAQGGIQDYLRESQQDAPGYARVRQDVADDTLGGVNASFLTDGRFGSNIHTDRAVEKLGGVLAGMDMQNYENRLGRMLGGNQALAGIGQTAMGNAAGAAAGIPGLYQSTLMPGQATTEVGQIYDADRQAHRLADADLFERKNNAQTGWNERFISALGGMQGQPGTQKVTPWWQSALGTGIAAAGAFF